MAKVYNFSTNLYGFLLKDLTRQMEPLLANTIIRVEAEVLVVSISFLFTIIGSNPVGTCPLVDFNRGGDDFISFCIGFRQTGIAAYSLIRDLLLVEVVSVETPPLMDTPLLPFFARILRYVDDHESDGLFGEDDLEVIKTTIRLSTRASYHGVQKPRGILPNLHLYLGNLLEFGVQSSADRPQLAPCIIGVCAHAHILFHSRQQHLSRIHGLVSLRIQHKYPWDEPLYRLVVEQGFYVRDFLFFLTFDPVNTT